MAGVNCMLNGMMPDTDRDHCKRRRDHGARLRSALCWREATGIAQARTPCPGLEGTRQMSITLEGRANSAEQASTPRVGVGVIVLRGGQVLLGKRKGSHGAGTWALPGGHLEFGESVETCAARETREETGLHVEVFARGPYTNDVMPNEGKHYVTVFVLARAEHGTPAVMEPEKCDGWSWFHWSALPGNLFQPLQSLVSQGYAPGVAWDGSGQR